MHDSPDRSRRDRLIRSVLDQRSAGDIADDVTAWDVGHKLFVACGNGPGLDDLRGVNDDASFRVDRACHLTGRVFHAFGARYGGGYVVDHCQHAMRAGIDACLTAYATIGYHDRVRIVRAIGVILFQ